MFEETKKAAKKLSIGFWIFTFIFFISWLFVSEESFAISVCIMSGFLLVCEGFDHRFKKFEKKDGEK